MFLVRLEMVDSDWNNPLCLLLSISHDYNFAAHKESCCKLPIQQKADIFLPPN